MKPVWSRSCLKWSLFLKHSSHCMFAKQIDWNAFDEQNDVWATDREGRRQLRVWRLDLNPSQDVDVLLQSPNGFRIKDASAWRGCHQPDLQILCFHFLHLWRGVMAEKTVCSHRRGLNTTNIYNLRPFT